MRSFSHDSYFRDMPKHPLSKPNKEPFNNPTKEHHKQTEVINVPQYRRAFVIDFRTLIYIIFYVFIAYLAISLVIGHVELTRLRFEIRDLEASIENSSRLNEALSVQLASQYSIREIEAKAKAEYKMVGLHESVVIGVNVDMDKLTNQFNEIETSNPIKKNLLIIYDSLKELFRR